MKKNKIIISFLILTIIVFFVINPKENISASLNGIIVWANAVLPVLLPFLFFTKLLSYFGFAEFIGTALSPITKKLYNVPGISAYVYAMSVLSGYPIGAKLTSDLYVSRQITKGQAIRITSFTSTSGPLFIIGTVGIGFFANKQLGYLVLISHFLSAIINGLLYRNCCNSDKNNSNINNFTPLNTQKVKNTYSNILEESMFSSIKSVLIIGGYICICFTFINILNSYNLLYPLNFILESLLHLPSGTASSITNGLIEVTKGCLDVSNAETNLKHSALIISFLISFGGASIHLQALSFLKKFNISTGFYLLQKTTHAILSMCITFCLLGLFGLT